MTGAAPSRPCALVLGASGFIGRWTACALASAGFDVTMQVRARSAGDMLAHWGATGTIVEATLAEPGDVRALTADVRPDVVLNLAGYGVDRLERDDASSRWMNAELPGVLAEACAELPRGGWRGVRLVHVGSALEYGAAGGILREDTMCVPTSLYSRTKLAGTEAVLRVARARGLAAIVARPFTVFGPGEHEGRLFPSLVRVAREGGELPLSEGTQRRDFAFVGDVADALVAIASLPESADSLGDVINIATGTMHTVREFVATAALVLEIPPQRLRFGALPTYADEMAHDGVSVERFRGRTGQSLPSDLRSAIVRALAAAEMKTA